MTGLRLLATTVLGSSRHDVWINLVWFGFKRMRHLSSLVQLTELFLKLHTNQSHFHIAVRVAVLVSRQKVY